MSHFKERKEKSCLNCGAPVQERYCGICGQENIEPRESAWHLVTHFFYDITHFDGKFFTTVRYLLLKPGFLTAEYVKGRRASHLHPIRMYVFTSAFFFLIYFSFISGHKETGKEGPEVLKEALNTKKEGLKGLNEMFAKTSDTVLKNAVGKTIAQYENDIKVLTGRLEKEETAAKQSNKTNIPVMDSVLAGLPLPGDIISKVDSIKKATAQNDSLHGKDEAHDAGYYTIQWYQNEATYAAVQDALPAGRKDGLIERSVKLKILHWYQEQQKNGEKALQVLMDKFKHSFPTMLFISLPFFAFSLKLLYIRRGKFYYVDHGIFAIHTYCALFVLMLLYYMLDAVGGKLHWWIFSLAKVAVMVYVLYYVYKAMRNFYGQGRFKTLLKYFLLSWMTFTVMTILVIVFLIISAYKV
ncbi:DUF3667 domain-containing protein [Agriterribacter sp.]|uniref:DUF3667 domain-containing protein n=1 Tax=Agriterribacter sp. TaxID=2821509 RepID=UPI002CCF693E|nr:DUF3667 domain-containing protein [Agriterribacter sp.]HRO46955.1 DUF3667 domain-containing protein [Agriterribacter sp.]HRQ18994.1 DUF3667 domain-containing protein [Agriterribacter sp.]